MAAPGAAGKLQPRRHLHRPGKSPYSQEPKQHERQTSCFGRLTSALNIVPFIKKLWKTPEKEVGRYWRLKSPPPPPPASTSVANTCAASDDPQVPKPTKRPGEVPAPLPRRPYAYENFLARQSSILSSQRGSAVARSSRVRSAPYVVPPRIKVTARQLHDDPLCVLLGCDSRRILRATLNRTVPDTRSFFASDEGEYVRYTFSGNTILLEKYTIPKHHVTSKNSSGGVSCSVQRPS